MYTNRTVLQIISTATALALQLLQPSTPPTLCFYVSKNCSFFVSHVLTALQLFLLSLQLQENSGCYLPAVSYHFPPLELCPAVSKILDFGLEDLNLEPLLYLNPLYLSYCGNIPPLLELSL